MVRKAARIEATPLTPEEREQFRLALDEARRFSNELLAKRGGRLFDSSTGDIAAIREEWERDHD